MPFWRLLGVFLILVVGTGSLKAQLIHGEVYDDKSKEPMKSVEIDNIYTSLNVNSDDRGLFIIAAASGELLEFKKAGYKTTRVRIPNGFIPSYFKIAMQKGFKPEKHDGAHETRYNYKEDSINSYNLYKHELDFPKMSSIDMLASPFSALSAKNRELWKFQEEYKETEQEKYVDRTFNEQLVTRFTGLTGDSLHRYMIRYRPSYEQLHSMNDYTFFTYVKQTVQLYRHPQAPRGAQ